MIDLIVIEVLYLGVAAAGLVAVVAGLADAGADWPSKELIDALPALFAAGWILLSLGYFTYFTRSGASPGKRLLGLKVQMPDGAAVGCGRALVRSIGYLFSLFPFGLGFLLVAVEPRSRALHDLIARTCVVQE